MDSNLYPDKSVVNSDYRIDVNELTKHRRSALMSKPELARKCGLSEQTIYRLCGGRPLRPDTLNKLLAGLGLTIDKALDAGVLYKGDKPKRFLDGFNKPKKRDGSKAITVR